MNGSGVRDNGLLRLFELRLFKFFNDLRYITGADCTHFYLSYSIMVI